jgi:hypothetical protein
MNELAFCIDFPLQSAHTKMNNRRINPEQVFQLINSMECQLDNGRFSETAVAYPIFIGIFAKYQTVVQKVLEAVNSKKLDREVLAMIPFTIIVIF